MHILVIHSFCAGDEPIIIIECYILAKDTVPLSYRVTHITRMYRTLKAFHAKNTLG